MAGSPAALHRAFLAALLGVRAHCGAKSGVAVLSGEIMGVQCGHSSHRGNRLESCATLFGTISTALAAVPL